VFVRLNSRFGPRQFLDIFGIFVPWGLGPFLIPDIYYVDAPFACLFFAVFV
jgi:hypothetical protein